MRLLAGAHGARNVPMEACGCPPPGSRTPAASTAPLLFRNPRVHDVFAKLRAGAAGAAAGLSLSLLVALPAAAAVADAAPAAIVAERAAGAGGARSVATAPGYGAGGGEAAASCPDGLCPGEVNGTLNTCSLAAPSCVSVMADDETHFVAPWTYDTDAISSGGSGSGGGGAVSELGGGGRAAAADAREAAVARLLYVATGGFYEPGLSTDPYVTNGYSRFDAAGYLVKGALSSLTGGPPPARPQPLRDSRGFRPFDGALVDRHTTADGSIYVRVRFGGGAGGGTGGEAEGGGFGGPLDAEFLFPPDDNIVTLRCAEAPAGGASAGSSGAVGGRSPAGGVGGASGGSVGGASGGGVGRLALSFERGLEWDTNEARRRMESLRKALRWEVVPVVSEFDPKFNNDKPLWFERLYAPFRSGPAPGAGAD